MYMLIRIHTKVDMKIRMLQEVQVKEGKGMRIISILTIPRSLKLTRPTI